jgi:hypothetical protein
VDDVLGDFFWARLTLLSLHPFFCTFYISSSFKVLSRSRNRFHLDEAKFAIPKHDLSISHCTPHVSSKLDYRQRR